MAQANIYWLQENYAAVEKIFRKSVEFCNDNEIWKLNVSQLKIFFSDYFSIFCFLRLLMFFLCKITNIAKQVSVVLILSSFVAVTIHEICLHFVLVGFYDPIVKKHEDNVRDYMCFFSSVH